MRTIILRDFNRKLVAAFKTPVTVDTHTQLSGSPPDIARWAARYFVFGTMSDDQIVYNEAVDVLLVDGMTVERVVGAELEQLVKGVAA